MKWYIVMLMMFALHGCKDTAEMQARKEKLLLENKKYFNSERAAKILYREAFRYFKYGTFLYPRPESILTHYRVIGDEPPYRIQKITADKMYKEGNEISLRIYTDENNKIDAIIGIDTQLVHYFNVENKKSLLNLKNDIFDVDQTQIYVTSCSFRYGNNSCLTREDTEDWLSYGQDNPVLFTNKAFKNYANYYDGKEIIYDSQSKMVKKIDYEHKKIKYYFYEYNKRYEIVCDYRRERCELIV